MEFGPVALIALLAQVSAIVKLPPAPYNVKLYCRSGRRDSPLSVNPTLCPTSSASCGYFEFPQPEKASNGTNTTGIYECVDSSIVMNEDFDYGVLKDDPFATFCADLPLCHELDLQFLNKQFFTYLVRTYGLEVEQFTHKKLKFCCTLSHSNLARLIKSGKNMLAFSDNLAPVTCSNTRCDHGSVGCFYHYVNPGATDVIDTNDYYSSERIEPAANEGTEYEYVDVKPVELTWGEEDFVIDENAARLRRPRGGLKHQQILHRNFGSEYKDHQCVKMHLNNEVYRYCMMIYSQKTGDHCIQIGDHKVCCCFVNPYETTCDPQQMTTTTPKTLLSVSTPSSTVPPTPVTTTTLTSLPSNKSIKPNVITNIVATTIEPTTVFLPVTNNQRTRCRTVIMTESRPQGKYKTKARQRKRIICDDIRTTTPETLSQASSAAAIQLGLFMWHIWAR